VGHEDGLVTALTVATAVACGLVGGVFFAFSTFVMSGLRDTTPDVGLRAMQSINRKALTPLFMLAFIGTAIACVVLGIWALLDGDAVRTGGCALYLVTIVVTGVYHVPHNEALAATDAPSEWTAYAGPWVSWNHLRTLAALGGAALLTMSLT
jgi:uncharacterized membrane protein